MGIISSLKEGVNKIVSNIKKDMAVKAEQNRAIKDIEQKAMFEERKKQAAKTAKFKVQLKAKQDRDKIKNPNLLSAGFFPGNLFEPQTQAKQIKNKKKDKAPQDTINPNAAMDMVNFKPDFSK